MDEEQPKKKITLNNFFESIQSADSKADRALRKNTSNLDLIDKNKSLIEGLIKSLKDIKSEVELIQKNISDKKDIEEDKLFVQEDQEQKIRRLERLQGIEGDKVDPAEAAAGTTDDSDFKKKAADTVKKALQDRGVMSIIVGLIGVNLASMLQNKRSFFGGMADFATGNLFDFDDKGRGLTPILPEVQEKLRQKPRGYGRIFGGIADYIMRDSTDFDKRGGNRPQNLNLGGEVKDNDNDTSNNNEDSVPAILTPGEFVVTKDAVDKVGVDVLEGLNASVGATNEPTKIPKEKKKYTIGYRRGQIEPEQLIVSSTRIKEKTTQKRMGGQGGRALGSTTKRQGGDTFETKNIFGENYAGVSQRTTTTSLDYIPGSDGVRDSNLKTKKIMEEDIVSVAVEDIIEHQDDLLKRIRRVKGYENVTIEDVLNSRVDMDEQKYARIIGHSDAAKATDKKQTEAMKLDREEYGDGYYNYFDESFNQGGLVEGLKKMFSGGKETTRSLQNLSDVDYYYLGLAISGEARLGSDDEFAVAASILNRVSSKDYKNNVKDVVLSSDTADGTREYEALNILDVNNPKIQPEVKKYLENPNIILSRLKSKSGEQKIIEMIEKLDGRTNYKGQDQISNRVEKEDPMFDPKGNFFHYNFQETPQTLRNATEEQKNYRPPTTEDFVKQIEPKPTGLMRAVSGVLDAVTGDKYDFDGRSSDNLQSVIESKSDQLAQNIFTPPTTENSKVNLLPIPITQQPQPINGNVPVPAPQVIPQVSTTPVTSTMSTVSFINMISNKQLSVG